MGKRNKPEYEKIMIMIKLNYIYLTSILLGLVVLICIYTSLDNNIDLGFGIFLTFFKVSYPFYILPYIVMHIKKIQIISYGLIHTIVMHFTIFIFFSIFILIGVFIDFFISILISLSVFQTIVTFILLYKLLKSNNKEK